MTSEMPFDLRSLGDVDSPEVVRQALEQFRRRAAKTGIWVLIGALAIVLFAFGVRARRTLGDDIDAATGVAPAAVYRVAGMTAVLVKVADLGDRTGIHLMVAQPGDGPQRSTGRDTYRLDVPFLQITHTFTSDRDRIYDFYFDPIVPADGRMKVEVYIGCSPIRALTLEPRDYDDANAGTCQVAGADAPLGSFVIDLEKIGVPDSVWKKGAAR